MAFASNRGYVDATFAQSKHSLAIVAQGNLAPATSIPPVQWCGLETLCMQTLSCHQMQQQYIEPLSVGGTDSLVHVRFGQECTLSQ